MPPRALLVHLAASTAAALAILMMGALVHLDAGAGGKLFLRCRRLLSLGAATAMIMRLVWWLFVRGFGLRHFYSPHLALPRLNYPVGSGYVPLMQVTGVVYVGRQFCNKR